MGSYDCTIATLHWPHSSIFPWSYIGLGLLSLKQLITQHRPRKVTFSKRKVVFQPSIFRGELWKNFGGVLLFAYHSDCNHNWPNICFVWIRCWHIPRLFSLCSLSFKVPQVTTVGRTFFILIVPSSCAATGHCRVPCKALVEALRRSSRTESTKNFWICRHVFQNQSITWSCYK